MTTVAVLMGGISEEREVSLRSGENVCGALTRLGYTVKKVDPAIDNILDVNADIVFNVLHGRGGEDGAIQGLMDRHNIRYTGSGPDACIMAMNKLVTKRLLDKKGLPTPKYRVLVQGQPIDDAGLNYPLIVKPLDQGSSVGVQIADTPQEFGSAAQHCLDHFFSCLVEEVIEGQEITVGVIEKNRQWVPLPILELKPKNRFYDYEAKYTPGMTEFILPARLSDAVTAHAQQVAVSTVKLLDCRGMARVDMMVDTQDQPMILEVNTIPGMTTLSDLPAQAKHAGISFDELVDHILKSGLQ